MSMQTHSSYTHNTPNKIKNDKNNEKFRLKFLTDFCPRVALKIINVEKLELHKPWVLVLNSEVAMLLFIMYNGV